MTTSATAPGKIMLAGEYAVLEGHSAVLVAIDRRAVARLLDSPAEQSPLLQSVGESVGAVSARARERAAHIAVDTSGFYQGSDKLGLGSSAATAVAATALALDSADRATVLRLAFEAHARAQSQQGARGSGADIAASLHGGVVAVRAGGVAPLDVHPLPLPPSLILLAIWSGAPASTPALVAAVAKARSAPGYDHAIAELAATARQLMDGLTAGDARACVAAIHHGANAVWQLAQATGVPLVTDSHKRIRALAASRGGAAKPTGAGGGDICLVAFDDRDAALAFRRDLELNERGRPGGPRILDLQLGVELEGLSIE